MKGQKLRYVNESERLRNVEWGNTKGKAKRKSMDGKSKGSADRRLHYLIRTRISGRREGETWIGPAAVLQELQCKMESTSVRFKQSALLTLLLLLSHNIVWGGPIDDQRIYFPGEQLQEPTDIMTHKAHPSPQVHDTTENRYIQREPHRSSQPKSLGRFYQQGDTSSEQHDSYSPESKRHESYDIDIRTPWHSNQPKMLPEQNQGGQIYKKVLSAPHRSFHSEDIGSAQAELEREPKHGYQNHGSYHTASEDIILQKTHKSHHEEQLPKGTLKDSIAPHSAPFQGNQFKHHIEEHEMLKTVHGLGHERDPLFQTSLLQSGRHNTFATDESHKVAKGTENLAYILNRPITSEKEASRNELNPSIKQAIDNIMKDMEGSTERKDTHHRYNIHKISHIKHTNVQNIGREPGHIQSTASNDDINLSELMNQLHQLEESPSHRNITWCEEKIREFLRALRRKQASGIYINEKVQEETLHQVLTTEQKSDPENHGLGVDELPMKKKTVQMLGNEVFGLHNIEQHSGEMNGQKIALTEENTDFQEEKSKEQGKLEHYQEDNNDFESVKSHNVNNPVVLTTQPSTILLGISQQSALKPEIMSQHYREPAQSPPFISDNTNISEESSPELPEFLKDMSDNTPIHHETAKETEEFSNEGNIQESIKEEVPPQIINPMINSSEHHGSAHNEEYYNTEEGSDLHKKHHSSSKITVEQPGDNNPEEIPYPVDPNIPEGFHPRPLGQLDLDLPEYPVKLDSNTPEGFQQRPLGQLDLELPKYSEQEQDSAQAQENNLQEKDDTEDSSNLNENHPSKETTTDHINHHVYGRPQASQAEQEEHQSSNAQSNTLQNIVGSNSEASSDHKEHYQHNLKEAHQTDQSNWNVSTLHSQQVNYETLIEELIQLESLPGHQAIDKCEEKILEFLEILKYQQELGFGKNQQELERLHKNMIEQTKMHQEDLKELSNTNSVPPTSFWKKLHKKIKTTYEKAKNTAKQAVGF